MRQSLPNWASPVFALLLVVVVVAFRGLLNAALTTAVQDGTFPWYLPSTGTVGQTVAAYGVFVGLLTFMMVPVAVFVLGYRYGRARSDPTV